ncbi:MAG: hypothetical protein ACW964_15650 [Candidatus Hodarchaeales archaeon]
MYNDTVSITVFDNVANSATIDFALYRDNTPPQGLTLETLLESSEYLYYHSGSQTFYYSNQHSSPESFTLNITAYDTHSALFGANGSFDFNEIHSINVTGDTIITSNFTFTYNVDNGETASSDELTVTIYDNVGNSAIYQLSTSLDNTDPTVLTITGVTESSEYLYYNAPTFYYSNDQVMGHNFTIHFTTSDPGAGLQNATGSSDFGSEVPLDTSYSTEYELSYNISQTETAGGDNQIIITVYDNVGNSNTGTLSCTLDNTAPTRSIITVVEASPNERKFYH